MQGAGRLMVLMLVLVSAFTLTVIGAARFVTPHRVQVQHQPVYAAIVVDTVHPKFRLPPAHKVPQARARPKFRCPDLFAQWDARVAAYEQGQDGEVSLDSLASFRRHCK